MAELNIEDKVYKFVNGQYEGGACKVVEVGEDYYGVIPTDCTINGEVPTIENTNVEIYPLSCKTFVASIGTMSIHKATPELTGKVNKYNTRMMLVDKIGEELKVSDRGFNRMKEVLLQKTTKQLFAILIILITKADGTHGMCGISKEGHLDIDMFIEEGLINSVKEPE